MKKIAILGAGTWGLALARQLSLGGNQVTVWSALEEEINLLNSTKVHPNLPKMQIPTAIQFTKSLEDACMEKEILLFAVPSVYVRSTAAKVRPFAKEGQIIVNVAKGIEAETLMSMTQIIEQELEKVLPMVALSGPTHAEEVALDLPTAIVSASEDLSAAKQVQSLFADTCMRVYTNQDIAGVELCGAMKNIIALAAGISAGLHYGDNTKAALITRGMAEITRLGLAMGCQEQTFSGLAGIGDLIVTATSTHSRNNRAGFLIGQGYSPKEAIKEIGMVVEGINALPAAVKLAEHHQVEMPIISAIDAVVRHGADPAETVRRLMERDQKAE
ncbi:MAG: NAD(P)-dependent glycerol-3-phosphate dehydrogenase [Clostridia bacterium]|nr:NAD(P)-dependent glycerol-3-phosphate dehydrogenase [Clostridia bacterium]